MKSFISIQKIFFLGVVSLLWLIGLAPVGVTERVEAAPLPQEPVLLTLNGPSSVQVGDQFTVNVSLRNIPDPGLYGVQFEILFDPAVVSINNLQLNSALSFVVRSEIDEAAGKLTLVASQQGKVAGLVGEMPVLSFWVTANAPGSVAFTPENLKISDDQAQGFEVIAESYVVSISEPPTPTLEPTATSTPVPTAEPTGEPTSTRPTVEPTSEPTMEPTAEPTDEPTAEPTVEPPTPTVEPTVEPTAEPTAVIVSGQVILPGRTGNNWSGATVIVEDSRQTGTTDLTGNFIVSNVMPDSLKSIEADAPGFLPAVCSDLTIMTPETHLAPVTLLSGDINDDDVVDVIDAAMVGTSFGQAGENLPADITQDNLLDIFDIVLVSVNYGEQGPQNWSCVEKQDTAPPIQ